MPNDTTPAPIGADALREALWICVEHNALHFGETHNTVVQGRAALAGAAPAAQEDALPREDFAWMVVQEACETEPADEDDPECIRILRRDLKSAVLAALLRHGAEAARAQPTPPALAEPLTSEQLQLLHHIEEFGLFCDYDEFEQIARTIEFAHGIGIKKGDSHGIPT